MASGITGCSTAKHIYAQLFYEFETLDENRSILYEKNSKSMAIESSKYFQSGISQVEKYFEMKLQFPIKLYIFTNQERFSNYSNASIEARAGGANVGIYLSPRMMDEIETLSGVIVHEIVHSYLMQYLGVQRYRDELPPWFQEGIAVVVSKGAGTEGVDLSETISMMMNGDTFVAKNGGNLYHMKHPVGMPSRVFYLQSSLFVQYISDRDSVLFQRFIRNLRDKSFENAFFEVYEAQVDTYWKEFLNSLAKYNKQG